MAEKDGKTAVAAGAGAAVGSLVGTLLARRPAAAAPSEEKLDHLIELSTAILADLEKALLYLKQISEAGPGGIAGSVLTPWVAREPAVIFEQEVRQAGNMLADSMVDYSNGKRLLIKVESSLDQAAVIQPIGNIDNNMNTATNVGPPLPCAGNTNISIGLAWDDWHPWMGVRMTFGIAPAAGRIRIIVVIQD